MKVYLDLVMILNFFIDFILLLSVSIILKRNANIYRIIVAAFFGGISILILFFNIKNLFLFKLLISIVMILISFGYRNIKYIVKNLIYLYIVSIILGGSLYLLNIEYSYKHSGIIFYNKGISVNLFFIILISPIIIFLYIKQLKNYKLNYSNYSNIEIYINNKRYKYVGYMDNGNLLVDGVTNKFVILIDKRKLLFDIKEFRLIPYTTASGNNILKVVKLQKLIYNNKEYRNALLGIIDKISIDGVDVLLNRKLLEG